MTTKPKGRWRKKRIGCSVIFVLGLVLFFICPLNQIPLSIAYTQYQSWQLQRPGMYEPATLHLARYAQTGPKGLPRLSSGAWLPTVMHKLGGGRITVHSESARIEMGGGFFHYGYLVELDAEASDAQTKVWHAYYYAEHSNQRLTTHRLTTADAFTKDELLAHVVPVYDAWIEEDPGERINYDMKIRTLVDFGRMEDAREVCREALEQNPEDWWIVLINALLDHATGSSEQAERLMTQWVERNPNYFSYLDLAFFYESTGHADRAATAILEATNYDADVPWGHGVNSEARGMAAAMSAYEAGYYEAALALCDHLAGVQINGDYAKERLARIRDAALRAQGGEVEELERDGMSTFWPFGGLNVDHLLGRKLEVPRERDGWIESR